MPTIELTATDKERLETLRAEIEAEQKGPYTSVTIENVLTYLLDLADTVEDPNRSVDLKRSKDAPNEFPREALRAELESRKRKDNTADNEKMDLYSIASAYDITGRSRMTKAELITTVLAEAERRYMTPFAALDLTLPEQVTGGDTVETTTDQQSSETIAGETDTDERSTDERSTDEKSTDERDTDDNRTNATVSTEGNSNRRANSDLNTEPKQTADDTPSTESGQLNAMLSLLETHDDKWSEANGESRYEVQLPNGRYESARTKDDVRALLFKNY